MQRSVDIPSFNSMSVSGANSAEIWIEALRQRQDSA